jgi:hypothetical protein
LLFQLAEGNRFNLLELGIEQQDNDSLAEKQGISLQANDSVSIRFHCSTTYAVLFGIHGATGKTKTVF